MWGKQLLAVVDEGSCSAWLSVAKSYFMNSFAFGWQQCVLCKLNFVQPLRCVEPAVAWLLVGGVLIFSSWGGTGWARWLELRCSRAGSAAEATTWSWTPRHLFIGCVSQEDLSTPYASLQTLAQCTTMSCLLSNLLPTYPNLVTAALQLDTT